MKLRSPAKINLFLKILGKRSDGFHELFSGVQTLSFYDEISISFAEKDSLICDHPELQIAEENLAFRALNLFKKKSGISHSFSLNIKKNIPLQTGLGGGSSNVATVLYGLNVLSNNIFSLEQLQALSAEISSDAPLFFVGGSLIMEGRGEKVRPYPFFSHKEFVIIVPKERLSTALVYQNVKKTFSMNEKEKTQFLLDFAKSPDFCNDLQVPAYELSPNLRSLAKKLEKLQSINWMSGSGTAHVILNDKRLAYNDLENDFHAISTSAISRNSSGWY